MYDLKRWIFECYFKAIFVWCVAQCYCLILSVTIRTCNNYTPPTDTFHRSFWELMLQPLCVICTTNAGDGRRFGAANICVPACEEELKMWISTGVRRVMRIGSIIPFARLVAFTGWHHKLADLKGIICGIFAGSLSYLSSLAAHWFSCGR